MATILNRAQRRLFQIAIAVLIGQALFPPWRLVFIGADRAPDTWPEGFAFLAMPPAPHPNAYQYKAQLETHIDWASLACLWAVTTITAGVAFWVFRRRSTEPDRSLLAQLESRKTVLSLLVGLGLPFPFIGFPAVLAPFFVSPGFEGTPFLFLSLLGLIGLSSLSFLLFVFLGKMKSIPTKTLVAAISTVLLLASGILAPSIIDARQRASTVLRSLEKTGA